MIECPVDEFVPLERPFGHSDLSYVDIRTRAAAACRTALLLQDDDTGVSTEALHNAARKATEVLTSTTKTGGAPLGQVDDALSTATGAYYLNSILKQYEVEVVKDAKRLRNYVTNKLILETENPDSRIRIKALELLGKISDVGLFTERTEVTINNRANTELADMLRDKLRRLMVPLDTVDAKIIAEPVKTKIQTEIVLDA